MKTNLSVLFVFGLFACQAQEKEAAETDISMIQHAEDNKIVRYTKENPSNNRPSQAIGTVSNGKLENGKLMPFVGENFQYFDSISYLEGRAFIHSSVRNIMLNSYAQLEEYLPDRKFVLMECANKNGGKLFPHRTHQNGLSADFMMPLLKNGEPYYDLDQTGADHYWLEFNENGQYKEDQSVVVDFDLVAKQILVLQEQAIEEGMEIKKVIIKIEFKDELFATPNGKKLKESGIYVVQRLTPMINSLHDDHFHVDFGKRE